MSKLCNKLKKRLETYRIYRTNVPWTSKKINIIAVAVGTILICLGVWQNDKFVVITGGGASLIAGVLLNYLSDKRLGNDIAHILIRALEELPEAQHIRKAQSIKFQIERRSDKIVIDTIHEFDYENTSSLGKHMFFSIYSDTRILSKANGEPSAQFIDVLIDKKQEEMSLDEKRKICKGKLCFEKDLYISGNSKKTFHFHIRSEYELCDRLVWSFQELSEPTYLTVRSETIMPDLFLIKFNHPNEKLIQEHNTSVFDINGKLCKLCKQIEINSIILPYQGFELAWDCSKNTIHSQTNNPLAQ